MIGDSVDIQVQRNDDFIKYHVIVIGTKGIAKRETHDCKPDHEILGSKLETTAAMAPLANVIVYYIQENGEVIYDQVRIRFESPSLNKVGCLGCIHLLRQVLGGGYRV